MPWNKSARAAPYTAVKLAAAKTPERNGSHWKAEKPLLARTSAQTTVTTENKPPRR